LPASDIAGNPAPVRERLNAAADSRRASIAYLMVNFAPQWEAASKQIVLLCRSLADEYSTRVVAYNTRGRMLSVNGDRYYPAPTLLLPPGLVRTTIGRYEIAHVFASAGGGLLMRVPRSDRTVLSMSKGSPIHKVERNAGTLRSLRRIVVETEQDRDLLSQLGVDPRAIRLIYPGAAVQPYRPATGPFTVLYATSPLGPDEMLAKGVHLLVRTACSLPDVRFILAWRNQNYQEVKKLVRDSGATNIDVRNGLLDMDALYGSVHATILPGLHRDSAKPCPQSLLDSMAHGKPVLVSTPLPISDVLGRNGAAAVFEPTLDATRQAILDLRDDYDRFQRCCHPTVASHFSPEQFVERHRSLYDEVVRA
jgi:glycosyltransferase involved in cell wall biosynthesis